MSLDWQDIEHLLGEQHGVFNLACPACGPDRPTRQRQERKVLRVWRHEEDFASYHCARCGSRGWAKPDDEPKPRGGVLRQTLDAMERKAREQDRRAREVEDAQERLRKIGFAEFLVHQSGPLEGPAEAYLQRRGVSIGRDQRFTSRAPFGYAQSARTAPGIVSAVRNLAGEVMGAHVVYLEPDGRKVDRLCFGAIAGNAIQLSEPVDGVLAVAEGWENARAFEALYSIPCWSAVSAPGVAAFKPPLNLTKLYVAADNDPEGHGLKAAQALAARARAICPVVIAMPKGVKDWNDELTLRTGRAAA